MNPDPDNIQDHNESEPNASDKSLREHIKGTWRAFKEEVKKLRKSFIEHFHPNNKWVRLKEKVKDLIKDLHRCVCHPLACTRRPLVSFLLLNLLGFGILYATVQTTILALQGKLKVELNDINIIEFLFSIFPVFLVIIICIVIFFIILHINRLETHLVIEHISLPNESKDNHQIQEKFEQIENRLDKLSDFQRRIEELEDKIDQTEKTDLGLRFRELEKEILGLKLRELEKEIEKHGLKEPADFKELEHETLIELLNLYGPFMGDRFNELFFNELVLNKIILTIHESDNEDAFILEFGKKYLQKWPPYSEYTSGQRKPEWMQDIKAEDLTEVDSLTGLRNLLPGLDTVIELK